MTPAETLAYAHLAEVADLIAARDGTRDPDAYRNLATCLRRSVRDGQPLGSPLLVRDYLTMDEAANVTGVSERTLRRHGLPAVRIGGRRIVATDDLSRWMRNRKDRPNG